MSWHHVTLIGLLLVSSPIRAQWLQTQWDVMGTRATLEFWQDSAAEFVDADTHPVTTAIKTEFSRINATYSPWVENSELYRVNANASQSAQPVSEEFQYLINTSGDYYRLTDGAFDITFASVGHLYDYRNGKAPDTEQLKQTLPSIGFDRIALHDGRVQFTVAGTRIDLGGIAKGHAIDRAVAILRQYGIAHAYISLGGDSFVLGDRRGRDWQVGIRHPRDAQAVAMRLPVANLAVSTSGDYERYFIRDGERIHHIINPGNGKSSHGLVSVTVIAARGIDADALSTSVFVMGTQKGLAMINAMPGVSAVLISAEGKVFYSDDLSPPSP